MVVVEEGVVVGGNVEGGVEEEMRRKRRRRMRREGVERLRGRQDLVELLDRREVRSSNGGVEVADRGWSGCHGCRSGGLKVARGGLAARRASLV